MFAQSGRAREFLRPPAIFTAQKKAGPDLILFPAGAVDTPRLLSSIFSLK
jgi:hypothetical protein